MEFIEAAWGLLILFITFVVADYYLIRRSTNRAIETILKRPTFREINQLLNDPAFADFIIDTMMTIKRINQIVKDVYGLRGEQNGKSG